MGRACANNHERASSLVRQGTGVGSFQASAVLYLLQEISKEYVKVWDVLRYTNPPKDREDFDDDTGSDSSGSDFYGATRFEAQCGDLVPGGALVRPWPPVVVLGCRQCQ